MKKNNTLNNTNTQLFVFLAISFSSALFLIVFWPALNGPFLFDDLVNLIRLSPGIDSLEKFYAYLAIGENRLGRPLSFISFLINDNAWPTEPFSFKYTNLLIHLLNALLIFLFSLKLLSLLDCSYKQCLLISTLIFLAWLFHPLLVSTYLYTVQRMTLLMATFTLLGLIGYLEGRKRFADDKTKGYIIITISLLMAGILGTLSKDSGVTLIVYILILEFTLLKKLNTEQPLSVYWKGTFLFFPLFLIICYIIIQWKDFLIFYEVRHFSPMERLLTESRILIEYAKEIIIPSALGKSVIHDDIRLSLSLINPISTFFYVSTLLIILISALMFAKKYAWYSFSVLWFLGGHLLESTVIPLELYYEHRNYLPMYGILFALSYGLTQSFQYYKKSIIFIGIVFFSAEILACYSLSYSWRSADNLLVKWAREHPDSVRSQLGMAEHLISNKNYSSAETFLNRSIHANPNHLAANLRYVQFTCNREKSKELIIELTRKEGLLYTNGSHSAIEGIINNIEQNLCHDHLPVSLTKLIEKLKEMKSMTNSESREKTLNSYSNRLKQYIHKNQSNS